MIFIFNWSVISNAEFRVMESKTFTKENKTNWLENGFKTNSDNWQVNVVCAATSLSLSINFDAGFYVASVFVQSRAYHKSYTDYTYKSSIKCNLSEEEANPEYRKVSQG